MNAFLRVSFVAALLTASAAPGFADVMLWFNPNDNPFFSYASQQDVNNSANSEALYDNFTLTQAATITSIQLDRNENELCSPERHRVLYLQQ